MNWNSPRSVETKIKRLTREIEKIDDALYNFHKNRDRVLYAGMIERKRDDMVRSAVLQMHTSIEDLFNSLIVYRILYVNPRRIRGKKAKTLLSMLTGGRSFGFEMKLNLGFVLGVINSKTKNRLSDLNTLRNKASHNWILKNPQRRGKAPKDKKPPLLRYHGRDLHTVGVLKDFVAEYGKIYVQLYLKFPD